MLPEQNSDPDLETDRRRLKILNYKVQEHRIEQAWKRFENAGFKPLLIKGWAAAQYYTEPSDRQYIDLDLAFQPTEFNRAEKFLETFEDSVSIDPHRGLRHLDTVAFEILYKNSQAAECGRTAVRVPCPEDHLRILCVHWLIDGGAKKDKLWDVYYAVKNRPKDFDWAKCLGVVSPTRRRWILCTIGLAHKYLGLELSVTPFAESIKELPEWLTAAVEKEWRSDTFLIPLESALYDRKIFWQQIKKRFPPNPIHATVQMEGEFDDRSRAFYQIGNFFQRLKLASEKFLSRK